jgi:hypothetical protein
MRIELLYFDGCPNHERLLERLPGLLAQAGVLADISLRNVEDLDQAQHERFLGSPTLRVDGRDVDPTAGRRDDYGLKCRIYRTPAGLAGLPPDEWILNALTEREQE